MRTITDNIIREYASVVRFYARASTDPYNASPRFTKDELMQFKNMEYVDDIRFFRYNFSTIHIKGLEWENWEERENSPLFITTELHINDNDNITPTNYFVFVIGYNTSLLHLEADGFNLKSGRMFENNDEAVITVSESYFPDSWDALDLGDKVVIKNGEGFFKEFTVVGILEADERARTIYTTFEGAEYFEVIASETDMRVSNHDEFFIMGYDVLIYLDNPDNFWALQQNMGRSGVLIEPLFPNFRALISLTRSLQNNALVFMALTGFIIICVTIISTLILLNSRKYEIAVLRSSGMKKSRLIANYLIENLAFIWSISLISLVAAQFISRIFTGRVFDGIRSLVSPEMFDHLTRGASLELFMQNLLYVFGGTTVIVMISLLLACINIIRFEPLKIFNKQY
jgi:hypothetical protein